MQTVVKIFKKDFQNEKSKQAYLELTKWIALKVIKQVEVGEVLTKITKLTNTELPTFRLELFVMLDTAEMETGFCDKCKEFHKLFYINQQFNCDACNYIAFKHNVNDKLKIKKVLRAEQIKKYLG